jgi:hypothetical protein
LLVGVLVAGGVATIGGPAVAKQPIGGCGAGFVGPLTIAEVIEEFPPPPGFPDPEGALDAFDANGDDTLCVRGLPSGGIAVVDNNAVGR